MYVCCAVCPFCHFEKKNEIFIVYNFQFHCILKIEIDIQAFVKSWQMVFQSISHSLISSELCSYIWQSVHFWIPHVIFTINRKTDILWEIPKQNANFNSWANNLYDTCMYSLLEFYKNWDREWCLYDNIVYVLCVYVIVCMCSIIFVQRIVHLTCQVLLDVKFKTIIM